MLSSFTQYKYSAMGAVYLGSMLVTGGSGFIGRNLCKSALHWGFDVAVITRDKKMARKILPTPVTLYSCIEEIAEGTQYDSLVNLAGESLASGRWTVIRKQKFYDSRIGFTDRLVNSFSKHLPPPKQVLSASAVGFYGHSSEALDENSGSSGGFSHYLCSSWEKSAKAFEALGSRVSLLRIGIVLGDGGALANMLPAFRLGLGGPFGHGRQYMSWIHLDDVIRAIHHCLKNEDVSGAINLSAPNPVTNKEFSQALGKVLGRPSAFAMPSWAARFIFGELADELLLGGQRVFPGVLLDRGFKFSFNTLEVALASLLDKDIG